MTQNSEDHLPAYRVRPRFRISVPSKENEIVENIKKGLSEQNAKCIGSTSAHFISLQIPTKEQHYWSPQLSITLSTENEESILRGVYGPRPAVWTMFVFFYAVIGLALLVVTVIGFSTMTLDKGTMIFWWIPVLIVVFLSLYLVAYFGQKMGHNQMITLQSFFEKTTGLESQS
jgi:hypothetical protein